MTTKLLTVSWMLFISLSFGVPAQQTTLQKDVWGPILWGDTTNNLQAGLQIPSVEQTRLNSNSNSMTLSLFLRNLSDQKLMFLSPTPEVRVRCTLNDSNGNLVSMTPEGRKYGKELPGPKRTNRRNTRTLKRVFLSSNETMFFEAINLLELFAIRQPGVYSIEIEIRLQTLDKDWVLSGFRLPAVRTSLEVRE